MIVHYQPIFEIASDCVARVEAFCRLPEGELGLDSPATYIPYAERHGLIRDLTDFVLKTALEDRRTWGGDLPISINVSLANVDEFDFFERVRAAIAAVDVDPGIVTFELGDGIVGIEQGHGLETLHRLALLGVRLSVDGFGSHISDRSVVQLDRIPVSELKIDAEIIRQITDPVGRTYVESIVGIAHDAQLDVVAKSVETAEQVAEVARLGCNLAQGYAFGAPMDSLNFTRWFAQRQAA